MLVHVGTIFPELFEQMAATSIVGRAVKKEIITIEARDVREFTTNNHKCVDDYPYGGGGGMVMMAEPFYRYYDFLEEKHGKKPHVIMMSARGKHFTQQDAFRLAEMDSFTIFCGHYKGIDARVDDLVDEEFSIGDFVLSGGEIPAMAIIDSVCRLLPEAVGGRSSITSDSFYDGILGPPEYTRPEVFRGKRVPEVLLGGNHAKIEEWRREAALKLTRERRPDLLSDGESPA
jgi:tRNA (guanine37-N1)-methyltransferase